MPKKPRKLGSYNPRRIMFGPKQIHTGRLRGVSDVLYAELDNCEVTTAPMPASADDARRRYAGAILYIGGGEHIDMWRHFDGPIVVINNIAPEVPFPQVLPDDLAIGRMAAEHFLRRGFKLFVYSGDDSGFGVLRGRGFVNALNDAGMAGIRSTTGRGIKAIDEVEALMAEHPGEPVAVLACNDWAAHSAIHHAHARGLTCPDQVAVLGVDNDPLPNSCCFTSISTVETPDYEIGYWAAKLLLRLLNGEPPPEKPILVPPVGVINRESTDRYATNDPALVRAVSFIENNMQRSISVDDIAKAAGKGTTVRTLQRRFREVFGTTMVDALLRARVDRAKTLIAAGTLSIKEVAYVTGFANPSHLGSTFLRLEGMTPSDFRKRVKSVSR